MPTINQLVRKGRHLPFRDDDFSQEAELGSA